MSGPVIIGAFVVFSIGALVGPQVNPDVVEKTKVDYKTMTVHDPAPPAKPYVPESCQQLIILSDDMADRAIEIDAASTRQLDLLRDATVAIHSEDIVAMQDVETRQRDLQSVTVGAVADLAEDIYEYNVLNEDCKEDKKNG